MINKLLDILLTDRTTGKHIVWANAEHGATEIKLSDVDKIQPRHLKAREQQKRRTRERAEIFTPPEVCELQNNSIDYAWLREIVVPWLQENYYSCDDLLIDTLTKKFSDAWFRDNDILTNAPDTVEDTFVANFLNEHETLWHAYVDARRLEITCGEAPYLVGRYNAVTGEAIDLAERTGLLDRKLRAVSKNTSTVDDWINYAIRALQSIYGYEFQGDNLFLARRNVFETVKDFFRAKFNREPPENFLLTVAEIVSWNLWQMDGLSKTYSPPFVDGANLFGGANCQIMNWTAGKSFEFQMLAKGARRR